MAFDQTCKASEVDIISLDFSQKLPFRLKLPMVQAAIKRGVHFEISYSHLISDGHARRQILSEAKMLGEWTRGKNLIISGSATSLNEVRGPHDVANLSTVLLGLSMERAKAAISKNCRSLVANALRKKDCYFKEAIKIERILPEENMVSQGNWFNDWNDWEPISSGVNDLPSLDDMAKIFSAASTSSKSLNAVDFTSSINGMAPNVPLFSCANSKIELDLSFGHHTSNDVEHNNVDRVFTEASMMVSKSVPNAANEDRNPCSYENYIAIDHFQNPSCNRTPMLDGHLSLTNLVVADVCGTGIIKTSNMGMENIEIIDQVDAGFVFTETQKDVADLLDCSFVGTRDQIPGNGTKITVEEHYLGEMSESEKLSSGDGHVSGNPDMMEVHEQLALPLEYSTSKDLEEMGGQEQSTVQFGTSISQDYGVKVELENQQESTSAAQSTSVNLLDGSAELEMQVHTSNLCKRNDLYGFETKTEGNKPISTAKNPEAGALSEDPSPATKEEQCFLSENNTLESTVIEMEGKGIKQSVTSGGFSNHHHRTSRKHRGVRGRSHYAGFLLSVKNFCKPVFFKKKTGRLRRRNMFLHG
ncbi:hypothetical protein KSP40_PGU003570 [Platanthera guangdongensis]|uniref:Uncharacterized protein n=1 Tax=Platanthera guangdongensis TaxID=2320717 RepID=A0ABR2M4Z3_9ASPA